MTDCVPYVWMDVQQITSHDRSICEGLLRSFGLHVDLPRILMCDRPDTQTEKTGENREAIQANLDNRPWDPQVRTDGGQVYRDIRTSL